MSVLDGSSRVVFVISTPPTYYSSVEPTAQQYWCGGNEWSKDWRKAALFQDWGLAKAQVEALNLRQWSITSLSVAVETKVKETA